MNEIFPEVAEILGLDVELVKMDMSNYELLRLLLIKYKEDTNYAASQSSQE